MLGSSATGSITATTDGGITRFPAAMFPCGGCHGRDGRGRPEGNVRPSDLTASALARPYEVTSGSALRRHGPYDDKKLARAITHGRDPAGNALDPVMPRYAMSSDDMDALLAFMKRLGSAHDPGVSDTAIRLGVLLPPRQTMQKASDEVRAILGAWADDVNRRGGIHGRNLELAFADPVGSPTERAAAVASFIESSGAFALVSSFTEGAEREIADVAEAKQIPLITSIASNPRSSIAPGRYVRELFAGVTEQVRALVRVAAARGVDGKRAAVLSRDERFTTARDSIVEELRNAGYGDVRSAEATTDLQGSDVVVFLDGSSIREYLGGDGKPSLVLAPAVFAGPELFDHSSANALLSFPTLPRDWTEPAVALHTRLAATYDIGRSHPATQFAALASAALVADALARAGRDLGRDGLLDAIDATRAFRCGFAPPLTFRPDRHLGSTGAWVIALENGDYSDPLWVEIE